MISATEIPPTMTDRDVARFVNDGYVMLEAIIPGAINRERFIRRQLFNWLCGLGDEPVDGSGPDKFHPTRPLDGRRNGG